MMDERASGDALRALPPADAAKAPPTLVLILIVPIPLTHSHSATHTRHSTGMAEGTDLEPPPLPPPAHQAANDVLQPLASITQGQSFRSGGIRNSTLVVYFSLRCETARTLLSSRQSSFGGEIYKYK
ncbi:hypothetical protein BDN70DRAFT_616517 [Pholiota conissans]|uniref:Uncharacterized protein n=1 Tax=Pholiota conissans TaxID=109636 RepID=A0A9P5Z5I0_9AGAR|nr:hypothetical protein BDN70DRAFT_616517 [Pholiota conissans]